MGFRVEVRSDEELRAWYDAKYRQMGGPWRTAPEDSAQHLKYMMEFGGRAGPLLDVGCGSGDFLRAAADSPYFRGHLLVGVDFSVEACRHTAEACPEAMVLRANIRHATAVLKPDFSWLTSIGSIEHFINDRACFAVMRQLLAPGGWWYFYVPNELWYHEDQPVERTFDDEGWARYLSSFQFVPTWYKRLGDNTAFMGVI